MTGELKSVIERIYQHLQFIHVSIKELDDESIKKLIDWIKNNSAVLEFGFFHYECKDRSFAERYRQHFMYLTDSTNE